MFRKPVENEFRHYSDYACAAVGYALFLGVSFTGSRGGGLHSGGDGVYVDFRREVLDAVERGASRGLTGRPGVAGGNAVRSVGGSLVVGGRGVGVGVTSTGSVDAVGPAGDVSGVAGVAGGSGGGDVCLGGATTSGLEAAGASSPGASGDSRPARGLNYERNKRSRDKKKRRKQRARGGEKVGVVEETATTVVPEWRRGAGANRVGYFSELGEDVQQELKKTRAQLLIAKNKRELALEEAKLRRLQSPVAAVEEVLRAVKVVSDMAKREKDDRIVGWAETVVNSYTETVSGLTSSSKGSSSGVKSVGTGSTGKTSVSVSSSVSKVDLKFARGYTLDVMKPTKFEKKLMELGVTTELQLVGARRYHRRRLNAGDFIGCSAPLFPVTRKQQEILSWNEFDEHNAPVGIVDERGVYIG